MTQAKIDPAPVTTDAGDYEPLHLYINGTFLSGDGRVETAVINPANHEILGRLPHTRREDLDDALGAASRAFAAWRTSSPMERSRILRQVGETLRTNAPVIARNIALDMGKPIAEAVVEVMSSADHCDWHAEECRRIYGRVIPARAPNVRQLVLREPVGVCAAFTPWNFPCIQAVRKMAAAIGAGCSIILKGPENAPSAIVALARAFHEAGLPPGVLNVVWGNPQEISRYLITSPMIRKVSFTGSVPVGKQLATLAGTYMKRTTMELGGHAPAIVFDDADIDRAAELLSAFKFRNAGQVCLSPSRFFVQRRAYDRFTGRFVDHAGALNLGPGVDPVSTMGPLAHERRVTEMEKFVADAEHRGGVIASGGRRVGEIGNFFAPTIVTELPEDAMLMTEEPFGPIATITPFDDPEDAIKRANLLPFGLSSYVFTTSTRNALSAQNALEAGVVNINHWGQALPETPLGGVKDSGIGSEGGTETFDGYLVTKFVTQMD